MHRLFLHTAAREGRQERGLAVGIAILAILSLPGVSPLCRAVSRRLANVFKAFEVDADQGLLCEPSFG